MRGLARICILISLVLALSLGGSVAQFGSKVVSGDADVGRLLEDFSNLSLGYWDIGVNPSVYDGDDVIYLDISGNGKIDSNDIRLTSYGAYSPGTKVTAADNDINKPLLSLPGSQSGIYFTDLYGSTGYDFGDPVYILATTNVATGARTSTNDVRLNQISGLSAGTKVLDFHPDHDKPAKPMILPFTVPPGGPIATIRFYNGNGNVDGSSNPIYDYSDDVYLDISLPGSFPFGFVIPNNVRLSAPV